MGGELCGIFERHIQSFSHLCKRIHNTARSDALSHKQRRAVCVFPQLYVCTVPPAVSVTAVMKPSLCTEMGLESNTRTRGKDHAARMYTMMTPFIRVAMLLTDLRSN